MVEEIEEWIPKTKLGKMVSNGEIQDIREIFKLGLPIMEVEIIDTLLPETTEEVINILSLIHI